MEDQVNQRNQSGESEAARPEGSGDYIVDQSECINSIARKKGFLWTTIWNHPSNAALKAARKDHNILLPGDRVFIPDLTLREESCATDKSHTFQLEGVPSKIKICLLDHDSPEPYANQKYNLNLDGKMSEGTIDGQGNLELAIDPGAKSAILTVGEEVFELVVSGLDPVDSIRGVQQRLKNLGFYLGEPQEKWDDESVDALKRFQSAYVVENDSEIPSGEFDDKTRQKVTAVHGC